VLSLEDALALVAERGRLFELAPKGAMLNVELPEAELKALCGDRLSIAAINGPTQGVVAGDQGTIEGLAAELGARGIEARRVHIDVAAHSHMIEPIIPAFEAFLRTLRLSAPRRPFLSCVTGAWITEAEAQSVDYWVRHLRHTVRFGAGVRALLAGPATVLLEVGPGRTLSSLARQQLAPGGESLALTSMRAPAEDRPDPEVLLTTAGRLWAAGVGLDFAALGGPGRQRVILPTYPWERRRFWIDPPDPAAPRAAGRDASAGAGDAGRAERSELAAWFHLPAWRPALPPAATGAASWLVLCEPTGLGAQVADQLASRGHRVTTVVPGGALRRVSERGYELDPSAPDACAALLAELVRAQRRPDRIAFCWGLVEAPPGADAVDHARRYGLDPLISLGQALGAMADAARAHLAIVTSGVQSVSGSDPLRPERALVLGPCRVLPIELPGVTCALVDVEEGAGSSGRGDPELAAAAVARVVAELEGPAECAVVALRGGRRWVQAFEPVPVPAAGAGSDAGVPRGPTLRAGGTYLVTGGLGGIGQVLAAHLARRHCARVALLGRSHVPPRGDWPAWIADHPADDATTARIRALQALDALGSEVVYVGADVADPDDVARALAEVRAQLGAIHGVIHAAGVPASGLIQVKEAAAVTAVLRPKVAGTLALERALAADPAAPPLDFFLVCSSRTATTGDLGQVDHAAANAFLEAFAEQRTQQGRAGVIALAWDTWAEVGQAVTTAIPGGLEAVRAQLLAHAIQPAEGPEVLERALGSGASRVIVSTRPLAIAAAASRQLGHDLHALAGGGAGEDRGAAPAGAAVTGAALEHAIAQIWSRVLRIERVGLDESFFDLGGNSVLGLRLVAELKRELGIAVSAAALFESPTVAALARRFGGAAVTEAPAFEERKSRGARRRESHARRHDRK
jgi:acyl transferase domain-containing protein/acyl carrier protein